MPLNKKIRVHVLNNTWPRSSTPPAPLVSAAQSSPMYIDVLCSLLFTALWTRPPVRYGFSLSDCWAWMRYIPAICGTPELRLRDEWTTLDPHHKTVLSGDFGVGFTTWFLNRTLGLQRFSDTLWVINVLKPGIFSLGHTSKRGPQKSPDYIAEDGSGRFSVVECKGTQTSFRALTDAINRGLPQKANVTSVGGTHIQNSLVIGLFVPQFGNSDFPTIAVADPDWKDVREELEQFSPEQLLRGTYQVAYAKELALFELSRTANTIARAKDSAASVSAAFLMDSKEQNLNRRQVDGEMRFRREYTWPEPAVLEKNFHVSGVRFDGVLPASEVEKLHATVSPSEHGDRKRDESGASKWDVNSTDTTAELISPLGSTLRLTLLEA